MDEFSVPKKVNRHVLKALSALTGADGSSEVPIEDVIHQVKYQMRNLVPVTDIEYVINQSLYNLRASGLVKRTAPRYFALSDRLRSEISLSSSPNRHSDVTSNKVSNIRSLNEAEQNDTHMSTNSGNATNCTELSLSDDITPIRGGRRNNNRKLKHGRSAKRRYNQLDQRLCNLSSGEPSIRKRQCRQRCQCCYMNKNFSYNCKDRKRYKNDPKYDPPTSSGVKQSEFMQITETSSGVENSKTKKGRRDDNVKKNAVDIGEVATTKVEGSDEVKDNAKEDNSTSRLTIKNLSRALKILNPVNAMNRTEVQAPMSTKSRSYVN